MLLIVDKLEKYNASKFKKCQGMVLTDQLDKHLFP